MLDLFIGITSAHL